MPNVTAVVGAQYGSEGKGAVVQKVAQDYSVHVRVGGPNAGHSIYYKGELWKMQSVPCGWINLDADLVIGAGALVNPDILLWELDLIATVDPTIWGRVYVDARAGVLDPRFHQEEGGVNGELHARIGSTGEGVGAARVARLQRDPNNFQHMEDAVTGDDPKWRRLSRVVCKDTAIMLKALINTGSDVLLEGTQGSGLSMVHGPWPYVTSHDTNAAQMLADIGLSPLVLTDIILVARTFPIRVAGNSGPLHGETTWDKMSEMVGRPLLERTTVTNKVRRIGTWDDNLFARAVALNTPTEVAITFLDYLFPQDAEKGDYGNLSELARTYINWFEKEYGVTVSMVGTGPRPEHMVMVSSERGQ